MRAETCLGKLFSNLINSTRYDFQDLQAFWGFGYEFKQLQQSLSAIADLVESLEANESRSDEIRMNLRELKEVAYEADDLLSELAYETTRLKIQSNESFYLNLKANVEKDGFRPKMAHKLKKVTQSVQNFDSLAVPVGRVQYRTLAESRARTNSDINMPVVRRQPDVVKIVNLLMSLNYQKVTIVPIIGMAGIGKTELAKLVSQEVRQRKLFDVSMWANVTDNFNERLIFREMLMGLGKRLNTVNDIRQLLGKELAGKRFLLVLDDVWDDVSAWWDPFKTWLLEVCSNSGNAIIVTTRSNQVASTVEASTQHWYTLGLMSDNECWSILKDTTDKTDQISKEIEREIAKKCRGLPLVAVVLGGTLKYYDDERYWLKIRNSNVSSLALYIDTVVPSLKLSFNHLPSFLKPCFVFCSILPKDVPIIKEELIHLWMAEGFVESCN